MSKKKRKHGARTKQKTSARKRKIQAQRTYTKEKNAGLTTKTEQKKTPKWNKPLIITLLSLLGVIFTAAVFCVASILILTANVTVEVGEKPDLSRLDGRLGSLICTEHDSAESVDTSVIAEREVECIFFGFIRGNLTVTVEDTTPPKLETVDVTVGIGEELFAEDFVVSCSDRTEAELRFAEDAPATDVSGEYAVVLIAEDEGGNISEAEARLTVLAENRVVDIEYGDEIGDAVRKCSEKIGVSVPEELIDVSRCGEYRVIIPDGGERRIINISVKDTTAPAVDSLSFDLAVGESIAPEDILPHVQDASQVSVKITDKPDFMSAGDYTAHIELTDEWGNTSLFESAVRVHDIQADVTVEAGTAPEEILRLIFGEKENDTLTLDGELEEYTGKIGEYDIEAVGEYSSIPVKLTVVDTSAPNLVLRDTVAFVGQSVKPEALVSSCTDATAVTLSFAQEPPTDKPNEMTVTVIAEDEAGNRSEASAKLLITVDVEPPVIYGMSTLYVNLGDTASYLSGVYAVDNADGVTEVTVDSSKVDTSAAGVYYVTYQSVDKAGNIGVSRGTVIVNEISQATVDRLADKVLSNIITSDMSDRDKAWAIFTWCQTNIRYSTRTSYLMGKFVDSAYSGLKTKMGNCYVYYAVAASLLTRAGIENIEIKRNSTTNPHYWNLVKIDGCWYHFDTCPHYAQYPITSFLLTDAEVRDYSENQAVGYYDFDSSLYPPTT